MKPNIVAATLMLVSLAIAGQAAAQRAYVPNSNSDNVSVIDAATNSVIATIAVGDSPLGVAVKPDGSRVFIANFLSNTVSVIDPLTNVVSATLPVGGNPLTMVFTPDSRFLYVAGLDNPIAIIDTATNEVTFSSVLAGGGSRSSALTPDGTRVIFGNGVGESITVLDTRTDTGSTIRVSDPVNDVTVTPDGNRVYVSSLRSAAPGILSVIDLVTNEVLDTVEVGESPGDIVFTLDGTRAYVANFSSNSVSIINTSSNIVIDSIPVFNPSDLALSPDGKYIYIAERLMDLRGEQKDNVKVIDVLSNNVVASIMVGLDPINIDFSGDGLRAYVPNSRSNDISVIDTIANSVIATIPVGNSPSPRGRFTGPAPLRPPAAVPTLSEWAMILFGLLLVGTAALLLQRQRSEI